MKVRVIKCEGSYAMYYIQTSAKPFVKPIMPCFVAVYSQWNGWYESPKTDTIIKIYWLGEYDGEYEPKAGDN